MNEFQHRIAEQVRVLAIVKSPSHFVEMGREAGGPFKPFFGGWPTFTLFVKVGTTRSATPPGSQSRQFS